MTGTASTPPQDGDITLELDASEVLTYGTLHKVALILATDENRNRLYMHGYQANPDEGAARDYITDKRDWSGGFGAYLHNERNANRYAMGVSTDCSVPRTVLLGPRRYEIGPKAGSAPFTSTIKAACEFTIGGTPTLFFGSGRYIYKLVGWPNSPEAEQVYDMGQPTESMSMVVFQGCLFIAIEGTNKYVYTADGSTFTPNGGTGNPSYANRFAVINNILHKMRGQEHSTCDNLSDAQAGVWVVQGSVGDICFLHEVLGLHDSTVVVQEDGYYNLDYSGNVHDIRPELKTIRDVDNGQRTRVWHEKAFIPLLGGRLDMWPGDSPAVAVDPQLQQERPLEGVAPEYSSVAGWVRALATHPEYLFAAIQRQPPAGNQNHRLLKMHEDYGAPIWHNMAELEYAQQGIMWVTGGATSGPVLWSGQGVANNYKPAYWILPKGRSPLLDTRCRFEANGTLYEPWLDAGHPSELKLSNYLEVWCSLPASTGITVRAIGDDGSVGIDSVALQDGYNRVNYVAGWRNRRKRLQFALSTLAPSSTPQLLHWRDHCEVLYPCRAEIACTVDVRASASHGLYNAEEIVRFMADLALTQKPVTLVDMWGLQWRMRPVRPYPQSRQKAHDSGRWEQTVQLHLLEEP